MTGKWQIKAVGQETVQEAPVDLAENVAEEPIVLEEEWISEGEEFEPAPRTRWIDRLVPMTAVIAMLTWTGFFAWAFRNDIITGGTSQQWIGWIINWAVPMLLISIFWLLSMRNSRREAQRFGDTAQMLRQESQALEDRLGAVNRELSLAREFLGSQSRELDSRQDRKRTDFNPCERTPVSHQEQWRSGRGHRKCQRYCADKYV